jgi:hypothetical protein
MIIKKVFAVAGSILILSASFVLAAQQGQAPQNVLNNRFQKNNADMTRLLFVDENGDGICDLLRDHDGDGIPNRQDPDWDRPQDGSGFQGEKGQRRNGSDLGHRNAYQGERGRGFSGRDFRNNRNGLGNGLCDNTGPKGKGTRRGGK